MLAVESHTRMLKSDSVELNVTLRGFLPLKNFSPGNGPGNELYVDFFLFFLQQTSKNMLSSIL